ncbi:MAG TPA: hypothetical protein VE546_15785 [Streptomyces sp.]|uniref:hypothetical protein n=1 Tax=Streptomyces sp. TaxID=1931 RepID=UPI002D557246|nr:hypothetical protein [Streptomyces sp.]HZG05004.1 hypothetical protein [Streptomyces sp.]
MGTFRTVRLDRPVLATALAACAAVLCAAPAAPVEEPGPGGSRTAGPGTTQAAVRVVPAAARPGTEVEVTAPACEGPLGTARSGAFVTDAVLAPAPGGGLSGEAAVRSDAEAGEHRITVECEGAGTGATGRLAVRPAAPGNPSASGSPPASAPPSTPAPGPSSAPDTLPAPALSPVAPVPAGGGGTAERATGEAGEDGGPGALHAVLGFGLAGAAGMVAARRAVLLRRRARSDGDR